MRPDGIRKEAGLDLSIRDNDDGIGIFYFLQKKSCPIDRVSIPSTTSMLA